jgi:flagellar hook assembly protein FlgD
MGRRVRVLERSALPAGTHRIEWDGRDEAGVRTRDGIYLVRMSAAGQSWTRKLVLAH